MADSDLKNALPPGTVLHLYTIEKVLGHGGFGIVYLGHHAELGVVAIKEYLPPDLAVRDASQVHPLSGGSKGNFEEGLRRFVEEAKQLVQFNHPNIIRCRDFLRLNGTAYLIMDFEDGLPLSELLAIRQQKNLPLDEDEILRIIVPILEGLQMVHEKGALHRDIKPGNIFIRRRDEQPVLLDFGAVKQNFSEHSKSLAPYSPGFAAIEQIEDSGNLGPWTDLYAIGAVMWRIIADRNPVKVESRLGAATRGRPDPLTPAIEIGSGRYSENLLLAIDKCLQLGEEDRYQSAAELKRALLGQEQPVRPAPARAEADLRKRETGAVREPVSPEASIKLGPTPSKLRPWLLIGAVAALVAGVGGYYLWSQNPDPGLNQSADNEVVTPDPPVIAPVQTPAITDPLAGTFIAIPAGSFQMGDEGGNGKDRERPVRTVQVATFNLATHEVTRGQFARFVEDQSYRTDAETNAGSMTGCHSFELNGIPRWEARSGRSWRDPGFAQTDDHPVVCVSYNDALAYIEWLNSESERRYRLPTEAEWEYALRSNRPTANGFTVSRLEDSCQVGNIADRTPLGNGNRWNRGVDCSDGIAEGTSPVGRFNANSFGVYDMVGNVSEWTADCWHENYDNAPAQASAWNANGNCDFRVLRGSSWNGDAADVSRASYRSGAARNYRSSKFGFRLVRN